MSTTIALAIVGIVILGITIFSFQFSNKAIPFFRLNRLLLAFITTV